MRLLRTDCDELKLDTYNDERKLPKYAILSHVWLAAEEDITFRDLGKKSTDHSLTSRQGWTKIAYARRQAYRGGFSYVWIDTCCIDKTSSAELAEAINAVYRWYSLAEICYVYLEDMPEPMNLDGEQDINDALDPQARARSTDLPWLYSWRATSQELVTAYNPVHHVGQKLSYIPLDREARRELQLPEANTPDLPMPQMIDLVSAELRKKRYWDWQAYENRKWFTRGWTLQEMLAPVCVIFYNTSWNRIGALADLAPMVADITGVHIEALQRVWPVKSYSIAQRMSWAANRKTTKVEDRAYSLLGVFEMNLPIIYGEGERAFARLQQELWKAYFDQTIFAWLALRSSEGNQAPPKYLDLLAQSPRAFQSCGRVVPTSLSRFGAERVHEVTDNGVRFTLPSRAHPRIDAAQPETVDNGFEYAVELNKLPGEQVVSMGDHLDHITVALRCCYDDDPSQLLTMELERAVVGTDSYFVTRADIPLNVDATDRCQHRAPGFYQFALEFLALLQEIYVKPRTLRERAERRSWLRSSWILAYYNITW